MAALTAAAHQAVPDSPAAPAQRALLAGLVRRQLKPHRDRAFRQFSATYKECMEIMAQVGGWLNLQQSEHRFACLCSGSRSPPITRYMCACSWPFVRAVLPGAWRCCCCPMLFWL